MPNPVVTWLVLGLIWSVWVWRRGVRAGKKRESDGQMLARQIAWVHFLDGVDDKAERFLVGRAVMAIEDEIGKRDWERVAPPVREEL